MTELKWSDATVRIGGVEFKMNATKAEVEVSSMNNKIKCMKDLVVGDKFRDRYGFTREIVSKLPDGSAEVMRRRSSGVIDAPNYFTGPNHNTGSWGWQIAFGSRPGPSELKVGDRFQDGGGGCIRTIAGLSGDVVRVRYSTCSHEHTMDRRLVDSYIATGRWGLKLPPEEKYSGLFAGHEQEPKPPAPPAKTELKPSATYTFYSDEADIDRIFEENPSTNIVKVNGQIWVRNKVSKYLIKKLGLVWVEDKKPDSAAGHIQITGAVVEILVEALRNRDHFKVEVY